MFVRGKFVCFYPTFIIQQLTTCSPFLIFLFCYTKSIIIHICTHATSTMHHIDNMYTCMRQPHVHAKSLYTNVHRRTPMYNISTYTAPEHQLCQVQKRMQNKIKEEKKKKKVNIFFHFFTIKNQKNINQTVYVPDRNERNNIPTDFSSRLPRHAMQRQQPYPTPYSLSLLQKNSYKGFSTIL